MRKLKCQEEADDLLVHVTWPIGRIPVAGAAPLLWLRCTTKLPFIRGLLSRADRTTPPIPIILFFQ